MVLMILILERNLQANGIMDLHNYAQKTKFWGKFLSN
jgi:hypothetical protein